jgi:hypothetical protein
MPKRLSRADSDDEDFNPSNSKKARADSEVVDIDDEPVATLSKRKPKVKKGATEESDTDMEDGEEGDFEEEHGEQIREAVRAKQKQKGGVADHGIIETVEMHNFMCHKYLTFSFGPQINFIIGHNGSTLLSYLGTRVQYTHSLQAARVLYCLRLQLLWEASQIPRVVVVA